MCPVLSVQGGGVGAIMPVAVGDECMVVFSDRCISAWFATGQPMPLPDFRMHDISDGFVLVGLNSFQNLLLTPLLPNEGGTCETANATGAKVVVNSVTHKISIKNATGGLFTTLTNLNTALTALNVGLTAFATTLSSAVPATAPACSALIAAVAAVQVQITAVQTEVTGTLY